MKSLEFTQQLPEGFDDRSRVWIYQCSRLLSLSEVLDAESRINEFVQSWSSHGAAVKGFGTVFFGRFVVLIADESTHGVSGCSTDSSVRFIKEIEKSYNVSFFDRTQLAFLINDAVQMLPLTQLPYALENGFIKKETLYFNNTITQLDELRNHWIIPMSESWLMRKFGTTIQG
jgi:hypothetical protein